MASKHEVANVDIALRVLLACFSTILVIFCVDLTYPFPYEAISDSFDDDKGIAEQEIEVAVDYDAINYQKYISDETIKFQNREYAIALKHFSDSSKDFSINGDKIMGAASTYKLFTAYTMYKQNYTSCIKNMIVYSDNDCPENWGRWSLVTSDARSLGATSTNLNVVPTLTTANDLVLYLTKLYEGSLLPESQTNELLSYMKVQVYREGIPAGIPEAEVADKVGFLDGELNDAGIVYSGKGDFALVVLTNGYSWSSIAQTASEIYAKL